MAQHGDDACGGGCVSAQWKYRTFSSLQNVRGRELYGLSCYEDGSYMGYPVKRVASTLSRCCMQTFAPPDLIPHTSAAKIPIKKGWAEPEMQT
jgi:hypothetical protein